MRSARVLVFGLAAAAFGARVSAAPVKPGLEGGQELFRQNRWDDARRHLRAQWSAIAEKDRGAATFLIGRSYVREAEFYRALRLFGDEIGLEYMGELIAGKMSRGVPWIPLFVGFYQFDAEQDVEAQQKLLLPPASTLAPEWKASARLRRAAAARRMGRPPDPAAAKDGSVEGRFCTLLAGGAAEPPAAAPKEGREKVLAAAVLFRAGRAAEAEALLANVNLDAPDVEDKSDPKKLLRFHDPMLAAAWERIVWERALVVLTPLATGGSGTEKSLAAYYAGLCLWRVGAAESAAAFLKESSAASIGPEIQAPSRLLLAAPTWKAPTAVELSTLWTSTQAQPEAVLLWDELRSPRVAKLEPFATKLEPRLKELLSAAPERASGALAGKWGLARLRRGDDAGTMVTTLSEYRDKSNKNKLEWNDPLLLLAIAVADARDREYAQALETLFELSKTFAGLRSVQWNLQGVYAARQKAGGEARISQ
jgi:hypothetical protein